MRQLRPTEPRLIVPPDDPQRKWTRSFQACVALLILVMVSMVVRQGKLWSKAEAMRRRATFGTPGSPVMEEGVAMEEGELLMDGPSAVGMPRRRGLRSGVSIPTPNTGVNLSRDLPSVRSYTLESTRHCESTVFGDFGTSELVIPELPIHPETDVDTAKEYIHDTDARLLRGLYPNAARNETPPDRGGALFRCLL
jgi:hypothetical protein